MGLYEFLGANVCTLALASFVLISAALNAKRGKGGQDVSGLVATLVLGLLLIAVLGK